MHYNSELRTRNVNVSDTDNKKYSTFNEMRERYEKMFNYNPIITTLSTPTENILYSSQMMRKRRFVKM